MNRQIKESGANHETLAQQAADSIIEMIRKEGLQPGDKLPTEPELAARLGIGRNTTREAVRILMSRNILTVRQGSGTYLSDKKGVSDDPLGFSMMGDEQKLTQDLLEVRLILEPSIAELAAQNADEEDISKLQEILEEMEQTIRDKGDFHDADARFHVCLAQCTHNLVMVNLIPVITHGVRNFAESAPAEYELTLLTHRRIFEAVRSRRGHDAREAMYYHLLYNQARYLAGEE